MSIPIKIEPIEIGYIDMGIDKTEHRPERDKINEIVDVVNYLLNKENLMLWNKFKERG